MNKYFEGCTDINECMIAQLSNNQSICLQNEDCFNTIGSFECRCQNGYLRNATTNLCEDINECSIANPCDAKTSTCRNNNGDYQCHCKTGFTTDRNFKNKCIDLNECATNRTICPESTFCWNTIGSYECRCPMVNMTLTADGTCDSVERPFECQGIVTVDDFTQAKRCNCPAGFVIVNNRCENVDECASGFASCPINSFCLDTYGGYECVDIACPYNYTANAGTYSCDNAIRNDDFGMISNSWIALKSNISVQEQLIYIIDGIRSPRNNVKYKFSLHLANRSARSTITQDNFDNYFKMGTELTQDFNKLYLRKPLIGPQSVKLQIDLVAEVRRRSIIKTVKIHRSNFYVYVSKYDGIHFDI